MLSLKQLLHTAGLWYVSFDLYFLNFDTFTDLSMPLQNYIVYKNIYTGNLKNDGTTS